MTDLELILLTLLLMTYAMYLLWVTTYEKPKKFWHAIVIYIPPIGFLWFVYMMVNGFITEIQYNNFKRRKARNDKKNSPE